MTDLALPLAYPLPSRDWHVTRADKKLKLWASREWTAENRRLAERSRSKSLAVSGLPALSTLEQYISVVNKLPMLTPARELELARRFRSEGDLAAARELIMAHLRAVVAISRGYLGYRLPHEELIQEGNIGLMKALKSYDPERGVKFFSYAMHWIKAEIHEYILKNWRMVKLATTKQQRKLFFNLKKLRQSTATLRPGEVEQIARDLKVRERDVREMEVRLTGEDLPLDPPAGEEDTENLYPSFYLTDPDDPARLVEEAQLKQLKAERLAAALAALDQRSRRIIEARWFGERQVSLTTLSKELNVSAERVRQIEVKAIQKLRASAGRRWLGGEE